MKLFPARQPSSLGGRRPQRREQQRHHHQHYHVNPSPPAAKKTVSVPANATASANMLAPPPLRFEEECELGAIVGISGDIPAQRSCPPMPLTDRNDEKRCAKENAEEKEKSPVILIAPPQLDRTWSGHHTKKNKPNNKKSFIQFEEACIHAANPPKRRYGSARHNRYMEFIQIYDDMILTRHRRVDRKGDDVIKEEEGEDSEDATDVTQLRREILEDNNKEAELKKSISFRSQAALIPLHSASSFFSRSSTSWWASFSQCSCNTSEHLLKDDDGEKEDAKENQIHVQTQKKPVDKNSPLTRSLQSEESSSSSSSSPSSLAGTDDARAEAEAE